MVNKENENASICMDGTLFEDTFKYLDATLNSDGASDNELRIRIAIARSAMLRCENILNIKNITFLVKSNLYK